MVIQFGVRSTIVQGTAILTLHGRGHKNLFAIESSNALEPDKKKPLPVWTFPKPDKALVISTVLDLRRTAFATPKIKCSLTDVFQRVGLTPRARGDDGKNQWRLFHGVNFPTIPVLAQANQDMACIGAQFVQTVQRNAPDDSDGSNGGDWGTYTV